MGMHVFYGGRDLGDIRIDDSDQERKVFVANGLDSLITLFRIEPLEKIKLDVIGEISYWEFSETILKKVSGFYPTVREWLLKNYPSGNFGEF